MKKIITAIVLTATTASALAETTRVQEQQLWDRISPTIHKMADVCKAKSLESQFSPGGWKKYASTTSITGTCYTTWKKTEVLETYKGFLKDGQLMLQAGDADPMPISKEEEMILQEKHFEWESGKLKY